MDRDNRRLLKANSRSFYLTLKVLPKRIRSQIGTLYLFARLSDTIADSTVGDGAVLLRALSAYNERIQGLDSGPLDLEGLASLQADPSEADLLRNVNSITSSIGDFSATDQAHIRRCLDIIIGGQRLDLERFSSGEEGVITCLQSDTELDDYAYRVAGSVGEFWTHVSLDHCFTLGAEDRERLFALAVRFGKALQLINILRDIPADLALGRCYIPESALAEIGLQPEDLLDPTNFETFRPLYNHWLDITVGHLDAAVEYIEMLPHRHFRLRAACMLPVLIGQRTLQLCRQGNVLDSEHRIKVLRPEIKRISRRTLFAVPFKGRSQRLLNRLRSP